MTHAPRIEPAPRGELFDLALPSLTLEAGATLASHHVRGFIWSSMDDHAKLAAKEPLGDGMPTVLLFPPLTSNADCAGEDGWWREVVGKGRALRPWAQRILCFAYIGSCTGSSGPLDADFPNRVQDTRFSRAPTIARGAPRAVPPEESLPATVTPWDLARSAMIALDALGVPNVALAAGGSLGAMAALCLAVIAKERVARALAICAPFASTAWMIGWNHVAREAILADPDFPRATRGLSVARQIARMTYRAEPGLEERQGRRIAGSFDAPAPAWSSRTPYRIETYLRHHGDALDFDPRAYIAMTSAMDHHDLDRAPSPASIGDIRAKVILTSVDTDRLVRPEDVTHLESRLKNAGIYVQHTHIASPHGHDAFLIEHDQMNAIFSRALTLSAG